MNANPRRLSRARIDVWQIPVEASSEQIAALQRTLSVDERQRAARLRNQAKRTQFVVTRAFLRRTLALALGCSSAEVAFVAGAHGKPGLSSDLARSGIRFNVSHTCGAALIAIGLEREIGVDVEAMRATLEWQPLARRFFSHRERDDLDKLAVAHRTAGFFACWARKEAVLKATGKGLFGGLDSFDVSVDPNGPARLLATRWTGDVAHTKLTLQRLDVGAAHAGALAAEGDDYEVFLHPA